MNDTVIPLAAGFPAATRDQWLALVEKTLKGASADSLASHTADGLAVKPLYTAAEGAPAAAGPLRRDPAWDIRAPVRDPRPTRANEQILQALSGGAASILLRIDPTGRDGVAIGSADDLAGVLEGVMTEVAPIALDAGFLGTQAGDWLATVAKSAPAAPLALHMDPLSAFARAGASPGPVESHLIAAAGLAARLAEPYPRATFFLASGTVAHESGGSEAQELALAAASAVAYAKAMVRAGLGMEAAFSRIVLGLSADADYFLSIAKIRAARSVWARIAAACGVEVPATVEVRSSGRMLTRADPWTNLVRLTSAGFAGAVGGADAVVLGAFTDALGLPTDFARRQARNTQLILMEEANLGRVTDPAGGAWFLESLTQELAGSAWAQFQAMEAAGGAVAALVSGAFAEQVGRARQALADRVAAGEARIVGVTHFRNEDDRPVETEPAVDFAVASAPDPRLPGPDGRATPLTPVRLEEFAR